MRWAVDMALGCSTNSVLHLLAINSEAGIDLDLDLITKVSARTPNLVNLPLRAIPTFRTWMRREAFRAVMAAAS